MMGLLPIIFIVLSLYSMDADATRKNILFFSIDDLRPELGVFYNQTADYMPFHSQMDTPNINRLARKSLLLKRAHVQYATCGPSRASIMTGRRPDTTRVHDLKTNFRDKGGNFTTIPQYFKEQGYMSVGMGKIYHSGSFKNRKEKKDQDPLSWSPDYEYFLGRDPFKSVVKDRSWMAVTQEQINARGRSHLLKDQQVLEHALNMLDNLAPNAIAGTQPFFMAVGFLKPHLPFTFPAEFLDKYPNDTITLPDNPYPPQNMPKIAWTDYGELRGFDDIGALNVSGEINTTLPNDTTLALRRAYYAAVSYTDDLVGQVIDKMESLNLTNNTIIVLGSDHGWQLGEHGMWSKHNNFELSTHAPLMIHIPGQTDEGITSRKLVEFVDIFPTLVEAAGFGTLTTCPENSTYVKTCTEGTSLMPLIANPSTSNWKGQVFSQYFKKGHMGYTMRTNRYRYTEWVETENFQPVWNNRTAREMYDHEYDAAENVNQVDNSSYSSVVSDLQEKLHDGWRSALPS